MSPICILLSIEHQLQAELLRHTLASAPEVKLVGETTKVGECLRLLASADVNFWIHSWDDGPQLDEVLARIDACHSGVSVVRINPNESAGYIQMQVRSLSHLLNLVTRSRDSIAFA